MAANRPIKSQSSRQAATVVTSMVSCLVSATAVQTKLDRSSVVFSCFYGSLREAAVAKLSGTVTTKN